MLLAARSVRGTLWERRLKSRALRPEGVSGLPTGRSQADVAQLVEQLIRNQQVSGSSPLVGSIDLY